MPCVDQSWSTFSHSIYLIWFFSLDLLFSHLRCLVLINLDLLFLTRSTWSDFFSLIYFFLTCDALPWSKCYLIVLEKSWITCRVLVQTLCTWRCSLTSDTRQKSMEKYGKVGKVVSSKKVFCWCKRWCVMRSAHTAHGLIPFFIFYISPCL